MCIQHEPVLNKSGPVHFCPLFIPPGGAATAVGDGWGFRGRPVRGIELCIILGGGASCWLKHRQAPDVGPATVGEKNNSRSKSKINLDPHGLCSELRSAIFST